MENKLLTVVVPVYQVEPYIDKCLGSLILPDSLMEKLEVLAVDDGTPDRSAEMAEAYEKKYPGTFRIIHKENGGHGSACNRGLAEAAGKYIRFLDSDDWFTTSEFVRLMEKLERVDADVVISNYNRYYVRRDEYQPMRGITLEEGVLYEADQMDWTAQPWEVTYFWRCTYRTAMLQAEQPLFPERVFYDDLKLFFTSATLARTVCYLDLSLYNYLLGREGQTMTPENQQKYYLHKYTVQKDIFDFYLRHPDTRGTRDRFLKDQVNNWLISQCYQLSRFPYRESRRLLKDWMVQYRRLSERTGLKKVMPAMMKLYFVLPFSIYYCCCKLKDFLTTRKTGQLKYSTWAR